MFCLIVCFCFCSGRGGKFLSTREKWQFIIIILNVNKFFLFPLTADIQNYFLHGRFYEFSLEL